MDFGSSHVYAGTTKESPYYSPVTVEYSSDQLQNSVGAQQHGDPIYESVSTAYKSTPIPTQPLYDPVYESSQSNPQIRPQYDQVSSDIRSTNANPNSAYEAVSFTHQNTTSQTERTAPKKSHSASNLFHKLKIIQGKKKNKQNKSASSVEDLNRNSNIRTTAVDKPLPSLPPGTGAPELPPPRLPPKPAHFFEAYVQSQAPTSSFVDDLISLQASRNLSSQPINETVLPMSAPPSASLNLYPMLPDTYESCKDPLPNLDSAPVFSPPVNSSTGIDLITFDKPPNMPNTIENSTEKNSSYNEPSAPRISATMVKRDTRNRPALPNVYASANTNVVSVKLGIVEHVGKSMVWAVPPVTCNNCKAVFHHHAAEDEKDLKICRFCGTMNPDVDTVMLPLVGKESDITYMGEQTLSPSTDDPIIVFCIDTSGSMCVTTEVESSNQCFMSRLQGVKEGILNQVRELKLTRPKVRAAIITFSSMVTLLGDGSMEQYGTLTDAQLYDTDYVKAMGINACIPGSLESTYMQFTKTVNLLKEHGGTALGPALLLSVALASQKSGSQVIVCTDGRANVGVGSLESESDYKMCHNFYKETSEYSSEKGVMVSILSIQGTDCRLVELGKVADKSAGKVKIATLTNLAEEFSEILSNSLMATAVSVNIVSQKELYFNDANEKCQSVASSFVGNATRDTEVTFKYGIHEPAGQPPPETAIFQLQVRFRLPNGCTYLRVMTQSRPVTENQLVAEEGLNPSVVGTYASQLASKLVLDGELRDAKITTEAHKNLINRAMSIRSVRSSHAQNVYSVSDERIYGSVCTQMDSITKEIDKVTETVQPTETTSEKTPPPLPPREYVSENSGLPLGRTVLTSSLRLPDVPNTPLPSKHAMKEAVENVPDEVASRIFQYRSACANTFTAQ